MRNEMLERIHKAASEAIKGRYNPDRVICYLLDEIESLKRILGHKDSVIESQKERILGQSEELRRNALRIRELKSELHVFHQAIAEKFDKCAKRDTALILEGQSDGNAPSS